MLPISLKRSEIFIFIVSIVKDYTVKPMFAVVKVMVA